MFNSFKKCWLVTIQEEDTNEIVPETIKFIARDWNAWSVWDAVKVYCHKKKEETGNPWTVVSMVRV